jgi:hypothetical protein
MASPIFLGLGRDDNDAAAVRSTFSVKPQCGIFYFEIDIVSKGRDGYIGIGFCDADSTMDKLPGELCFLLHYYHNYPRCQKNRYFIIPISALHQPHR